MANVAVIGAGAMGLAAAYHALNDGHKVTVFEHDKIPGGMAAHFDFDGLSIERFYHFVCKSDQSLFDLMEELGIGDKMIWRETGMGYYIDGQIYPWGDPVSLLKFPKLDIVSKFRYGLQMFHSTKREDWSKLENLTAKNWFIAWSGRKTYDVLWKRLMELKFYELADDISAAWVWNRIKRVGNSRKSMLRDEIGVIEGGSQMLIDRLVEKITELGGEIRLSEGAQEIMSEDSRVTGVRTYAGEQRFDYVISTMPTPFIPDLVPSLPEYSKEQYRAIRNIGVVCVLFKLKKPVTCYFWLNISDENIDIPGIVEFSNLRPLSDTIIYVPYYMPQTHPKFNKDDDFFLNEAFGYLKQINPDISDEDLIASRVGRLKYAQPVCEAGFYSKIPPVQTPIEGLQIADTCFYYPEDRGISESVRFGKMMAMNISHNRTG